MLFYAKDPVLLLVCLFASPVVRVTGTIAPDQEAHVSGLLIEGANAKLMFGSVDGGCSIEYGNGALHSSCAIQGGCPDPATFCAADTTFVNSKCHPPDPATFCADGTMLVDDKCVPVCGELEYNINGKCVPVPACAESACLTRGTSIWSAALSIGSDAFRSENEIFETVSRPGVVEDEIRDTSLKSVSFPYATSIGANAFNGATSLTSVSCPAVTSIGEMAFYDASSLKSVSFPNATSIGANAFRLTGLTSVSFPAATSIGTEAFRLTSLTSVSFPAVTSIGTGAFMMLTSLTSVSFPNATSIGAMAFYGASSLTSVTFPAAICMDASAHWLGDTSCTPA